MADPEVEDISSYFGESETVKSKLLCPSCRSEMAEVILRLRLLYHKPAMPPPDPGHLVGCFACLSLFTCSENGCLRPFSDEELDALGQGLCFYMFWVIKKEEDSLNPQPGEGASYDDTSIDFENELVLIMQDPTTTVHNHSESHARLQVIDRLPSRGSVRPLNDLGGDDITSGIENEPGITRAPSFDALCHPLVGSVRPEEMIHFVQEGVLVMILKSIVYGGLMEVIASSSVVTFVAASDASALSILTLVFASVIGGVFVIGHNLWDLRDDEWKYRQLLGPKKYFPLHAFFAILSIIVFGMVPPIAYGFSFHQTNDKDFAFAAVATTSLLCVSSLAILKASCIKKYKVFGYFKTVVYYVTIAVLLLNVSYAIGNQLTRLTKEFELFDKSSRDGVSCIPLATPSFA